MNAASVAATLKAKGQAMTLTRVSGGTFDPVTGGIAGAVTQTFTVYGITTNYRMESVNATNSLIQSGDKMAKIGATVTEPGPGDKLTIMGDVWTVIAVDTLAPQGVALMYTIQIRK